MKFYVFAILSVLACSSTFAQERASCKVCVETCLINPTNSANACVDSCVRNIRGCSRDVANESDGNILSIGKFWIAPVAAAMAFCRNRF